MLTADRQLAACNLRHKYLLIAAWENCDLFGETQDMMHQITDNFVTELR